MSAQPLYSESQLSRAAASSSLRLAAAIAGAFGAVPCRGKDSEDWTSTSVLRRARAVAACAECPALIECAEYAALANERWHVWGGVDQTPIARKKRNAN